MITATHPLPEELMAYADGEVSGALEELLAQHVAECEACQRVKAQFEEGVEVMHAWSVEAVPARINEKVQVAGAHDWNASRRRFPAWSKWALGLGLSAATLFFLTERHSSQVANTMRPTMESPAESVSAYAGSRRQNAGEVMESYQRDFEMNKQQALSESAADDQLATRATPTGFAGGPVPPGRAPAAEPMIARSVSVALVVKDFAAARADVDAILARHRGYAAQLTANTAEGAPRTLQASLRVPADELAAVLSELKVLGRLEKESQSGQEVTQQHADLLARLKNARETEQRLQAILQQRTGKISDVLAVEQEIARVRGEIEEMEAEQKSLEHRVQFATVELRLADEYKAQLVIPPLSAGTRLHNAVVEGYRNVGETLLGIVVFFAEYGATILIWVVLLGGPVFFVWRRYRRSLAAI